MIYNKGKTAAIAPTNKTIINMTEGFEEKKATAVSQVERVIEELVKLREESLTTKVEGIRTSYYDEKIEKTRKVLENVKNWTDFVQEPVKPKAVE